MRFQTIYEGRWIFLILAVLALLSTLVSPWIGLFFLALIACSIAFFRDPDRLDPADENAIVAAADGVVADVTETEEPMIMKGRAKRIGIFLSVFDVHTNRAPLAGRVTFRHHTEGLCLDARRTDCSEKNESMTWVFENQRCKVVVRQLTGAIARRIVGWAQVGDELRRGERFGMIRFGSRTEIYLPLTAEVLVKVGDRVKAGASTVARLRDL